jgi:hypothetical protein
VGYLQEVGHAAMKPKIELLGKVGFFYSLKKLKFTHKKRAV